MELDYTKWDPGVALAKDVVLEACPKCGKSCHRCLVGSQRNPKTLYVHAARIDVVPPKERRPRKETGGPFKRRNPVRPNRARKKLVHVRWCDEATAKTA